jgi:hypothetical protein
VHIYRDEKLVVKWDLENRKPMKGEASRRILKLNEELESEGRISPFTAARMKDAEYSGSSSPAWICS